MCCIKFVFKFVLPGAATGRWSRAGLWCWGRAEPGGPAAAWYFVCLGIYLYVLDIFGYMWIYLNILFGIFLKYVGIF